MTPLELRRAFIAVLLLLGLAAAGCGHSLHEDPIDIVVEVHNLHGDIIWLEGVDGAGFLVDFGHVHDGEIVDFVISDYWEGRALRARCECDGSIIDVRTAYDGMHWDVF